MGDAMYQRQGNQAMTVDPIEFTLYMFGVSARVESVNASARTRNIRRGAPLDYGKPGPMWSHVG